MASKPQNHVTRQMAERFTPQLGSQFPDLTQAQVDWLAVNFPPRCYDHRRETLEDHIKYSGKAELAAALIQQWDDRLASVSPDISADAEIAQRQP